MGVLRVRTSPNHGLNDNRRPKAPYKFRPGPKPMQRYPLPKPIFRLPGGPKHWPRPLGNLVPPWLRIGKNLYHMADFYYSSLYGRQNPQTAGAFRRIGNEGGWNCYHFKPLGYPPYICPPYQGPIMLSGSQNQANNCPTWHYTAQVIPAPSWAPTQTGYRAYAGPKRGGIFGCARMDFEHVWRGGSGSVSVPIGPNLRIIPTVIPLPLPAPEPPAIVDGGVEPAPRPGRPLPDYKYPPAPYEDPAFEPRPDFSPRPALHRRVKPDGKRERKGFFLNQGLLKKIGDGYGKLTEVKDFLDALAAGLPTRLDKNGKEIPGKEYYEYRYAKGLQNKAKVLLKYWNKIDPQKAAWAYVKAQAADYAVGKLNQGVADRLAGSGYWRSPRGPGVFRQGGFLN